MAYILNCTFMVEATDVMALRTLLRKHVAPILSGIDNQLLRLDTIQDSPLPSDHARSLSLQCRFADEDALQEFNHGPLAHALAALSKELPQPRCMTLRTVLSVVSI